MNLPAATITLLAVLVSPRTSGQQSAHDPPQIFVCQSGARLQRDSLCDGRHDCADGSDESRRLCQRTVCPAGSFRCQYGACVGRERVCDGLRDCADGSDEEACGRRPGSCARNHFRCKRSGHCVPANRVCDGHLDCPLIDFLHDDNNEAGNDNIYAAPYAASSDEAGALCSVPVICPRNAFRCRYGGCVAAEVQCDGFADCADGSDESERLCAAAADCRECREAIRCDGIDVRRLDAVCELRRSDGGWGGRRVACDQPVPVGTRAQYSCKDFFEPATAKDRHNDLSLCQLDGTWSRDPLRCQPSCGLRYPLAATSAAMPLVVRGQPVATAFPWHVSLFLRLPAVTDSEELVFWCGATLISELVVLTAAHCLWQVPAEAVRAVIGSTSAHYFRESSASNSSAEDELFARTLPIRRLRLHPLYMDRYGSYGSDIALLELANPVRLGPDVLPACLDWQLDDIGEHLQPENLGYVMGMGQTELADEDGAVDGRMRMAAMPVVGHEVCLRRQRRDFRKYVTFGVFCAGWANGTGVCNGDSGGGLVFRGRVGAGQAGWATGSDGGQKWYLQGVVSLSPRSLVTGKCDVFAYTIFTKVGMYVQWIGKLVRRIHEGQPDAAVEEELEIF